MNCRQFLAALAFALTAHAAEPVPLGSDMARQLALDLRVFPQQENARLVMGTVAKHERNPLFQADEPWENATNNLYPNVACWRAHRVAAAHGDDFTMETAE